MNSLSDYAIHQSRDNTYKLLDEYFNLNLPDDLKNHREYFRQGGRGYGENAFHSMWYLLFGEFKPIKCLEIGVYRGQVLTLWAMLGRHFGYRPLVSALSPFSSLGDSVSTYDKDLDYLKDTLENHDFFSLPRPEKICVDISTSENAKEFIAKDIWDLILIDGGHDYDTVLSDFEISYSSLAPGGFIVFDDSSLYFDYAGGIGKFRGHPGPSLVARNIAINKMKLLAGVGHNNIFQKKK